MTFNYKPSSDIAENKIVVMDYMTTNLNSFDNLNSETIVWHKFNVPFEDIVKMFKEKLMTKIVDAKYVMSDKDAIDLDKMIGLAYIAMSESEKNNKLLRTRNSILQNKYENYDQVVKDCNGLKSEINKIKINLCLALGRRFNENENVMHLTNFCAALAARENEYHYILKENDKLKYVINKQLMDIREITLNNYDEILQSVEKFKEELYIKDLKISQLNDDLRSINEEKNIQLQLLHDNLADFPEKCIDQNVNGAFECSNNELYEGKMLIAEQINQIQGSTDFEFENYQLCDLINMLARLTANKEEHLKTINRRSIRNIEDNNQQLIKEINDHKKWQNHLENENEKLNSEFEDKKRVQRMLISKINENKELKEDYSKVQLMYDELNKKHAHLITLLDDHRQLLTEKKMKCVDGDNLIKTLQLNLTEQTNKFELAIAKYNKEKEKCQRNETHTQVMIDEFTKCVHEKEIDIASLRNECNDLKHHIKSEEDYIGNLKHEVITLEYALNEKNRTIQDMLKAQRKQQQQHTAMTSRSSSLISGDQFHINSKLEQQMDILLENICTWQNIIVGYEKVLYNMQNIVQQQSKKRNYWIAKYQHLIDIEHKADKLTNEKELILFQHQKEMENIKEKYNSEISHMAGMSKNIILGRYISVYVLL